MRPRTRAPPPDYHFRCGQQRYIFAMSIDSLHALHLELGARVVRVGAAELVGDYGNPSAEYQALTERAGVLDLSARSRLSLTGADRVRFLHGQVTNNVKDL